MKGRLLYAVLCLGLAPAALHAQSARIEKPSADQKVEAPSMRDQLMPKADELIITAPVISETKVTQPAVAQPVMSNRGSGLGYMIAGGALFAAGLIVGGDAGTVMVLSGAGIGAYGLYLHFR